MVAYIADNLNLVNLKVPKSKDIKLFFYVAVNI